MNGYNSLYSLYFKKANIDCASLSKEDIVHIVPGTSLALLYLYEYTLGFYVSAGNPKNIQSIQDLLRPDVRLANRE